MDLSTRPSTRGRSWYETTVTSAKRVDPAVKRQKVEKQPSKIYRALEELQAKLRQKQINDPAFSQSHIFNFCAPLFVFLCVFTLGVFVPRQPQLKAQVADLLDGGTSESVVVLLLLVSGVLGGLLVLRGAIWVMARLATSLCEMDLRKLGSARVNAGGDEFTLTQANLIVGGILS